MPSLVTHIAIGKKYTTAYIPKQPTKNVII